MSPERTAKTTGITKIPQPHGGTLNSGGTPGNRGGGRPPDLVAQLSRQGYEEAVPTLRLLAKAFDPENGVTLPGVKASDVVKAIDVLGKYGKNEKQKLPLDKFKKLAAVTQEWAERHGLEVTEERGTELRNLWFDVIGDG